LIDWTTNQPTNDFANSREFTELDKSTLPRQHTPQLTLLSLAVNQSVVTKHRYYKQVNQLPSNSLFTTLTSSDSSAVGATALSRRDYVCQVCKNRVKANEYHIHERPGYQPNYNNKHQQQMGVTKTTTQTTKTKTIKGRQARVPQKVGDASPINFEHPLYGNPCMTCSCQSRCEDLCLAAGCNLLEQWVLNG
jgi:hypothetical protein